MQRRPSPARAIQAQQHEFGMWRHIWLCDVTSNLVSRWFRTVTVSGRNAITVAHKRSYPLPVLSCDPERKHVWYFNRRRSHMVVSFISHPMHLATQSAWGAPPCQYAGLEDGLVVVWGRFRSAGTGACMMACRMPRHVSRVGCMSFQLGSVCFCLCFLSPSVRTDVRTDLCRSCHCCFCVDHPT